MEKLDWGEFLKKVLRGPWPLPVGMPIGWDPVWKCGGFKPEFLFIDLNPISHRNNVLCLLLESTLRIRSYAKEDGGLRPVCFTYLNAKNL